MEERALTLVLGDIISPDDSMESSLLVIQEYPGDRRRKKIIQWVNKKQINEMKKTINSRYIVASWNEVPLGKTQQ